MNQLSFLAIILICPVISMTLGGLFAFKYQLGPKVISGMQHLASGILIGTVAWELVPDIDAVTRLEKGASVTGFISGVAFLLFLGRFEFARLTRKCYGGTYRDFNRERLMSAESDMEDGGPRSPVFAISPKSPGFPRSKKDVENIRGLREEETKVPDQSEETPLQKTPVPLGLIFGVILDGAIDGLLIGLSYSIRTSAGLLTSLALSFEMCLLGISTSSTLHLTVLPEWVIVLSIFLFPLPIFGSGMLGANALTGLTGPYLVFVISFGIGALLFLVSEELLIKAHEDSDTDRWYVTVLFYFGFLFVMGLEFI